jgi:hypothetical protein
MRRASLIKNILIALRIAAGVTEWREALSNMAIAISFKKAPVPLLFAGTLAI